MITFILCFYQLLRLALFPFVWVLCQFSSALKKRYRDERILNQTFERASQKADFCFAISSEGELQQVQFLLEDLLRTGFRVELVFSSLSAQEAVLSLKKRCSHLRVGLFPYLSYLPWISSRDISRQITAKKLILCRYDFFPEYLLYTLKHPLIIVAATAKGLKRSQLFKFFWYQVFFRQAEKIVPTHISDQESLKKLFGSSVQQSFDFRWLEISRRLSKREEHFIRVKLDIKKWRDKINSCRKNLIMGSLWPEDMESFEDEIWSAADHGELFILIAPHKLDAKTLDFFRHFIKPYQNIELMEQRGVLCEFYAEFDNAFVGGGFEGGQGIHSVLEPFVAGCRSFCGSNTSRSTEFDSIRQQASHNPLCSPKNPLTLARLQVGKTHQHQAKSQQLMLKYQRIKEIIIGSGS